MEARVAVFGAGYVGLVTGACFADLSRVWTVIDELPRLAGSAVVVMKSTVPIGTGEKVRAGLDARGLHEVGYVSNPEFLSEGTAVRDLLEPDRATNGSI